MADAAAVARAGYEGFRAGKRIVIPGLINKVGVQSIRVSPRALATRMRQAHAGAPAVIPEQP